MRSHENYPPELHLICVPCWERNRPLYAEEVEVDIYLFCCFCGILAESGTFVRPDAKSAAGLKCKQIVGEPPPNGGR